MKNFVMGTGLFLSLSFILSGCQLNEESRSDSSNISSSKTTTSSKELPLEVFGYAEEDLVHSEYDNLEDAENDLEVTDGKTTQKYAEQNNIEGGRIIKKGTNYEMIYLREIEESEKWEAYFQKKVSEESKEE